MTGDVMVFVGIVALVVVAGVLLGIIVAGRIDRLMAPRPVPRDEARTEEEEQP